MTVREAARTQQFGSEADIAQTAIVTASILWLNGATDKRVAQVLQGTARKITIRQGEGWTEIAFGKIR